MITSTHNPRLKALRRLHDRKHRDETGLFLAEGEDMLAEALRWGVTPEEVYYDPGEIAADDALLASLPESVEPMPVSREALARVGTLGSGSRLLGAWRQRWADLDGAGQRDVAVYLHEVADPGNVGTVVRSALAIVPSTVILSPGAADPFGPKAVRASMGAIFGQAIARATFEGARSALGDRFASIALVPAAGRPLREVDASSPVLFCLGAERLGLPPQVVAACDEKAHVPLQAGGIESLNVAMTATLCLYESAVHRLSSVPPATTASDA